MAVEDLLAIGAVEAIKISGLSVPDDISIFGFDDLPESYMVNPKLSSIRFPLFELGKVSAETLIKILKKEDNNIKRVQVLGTELIIRDSCNKFTN